MFYIIFLRKWLNISKISQMIIYLFQLYTSLFINYLIVLNSCFSLFTSLFSNITCSSVFEYILYSFKRIKIQLKKNRDFLTNYIYNNLIYTAFITYLTKVSERIIWSFQIFATRFLDSIWIMKKNIYNSL